MEILTTFHFLRPLWLLAAFPALLAAWWLLRHQANSGSWRQVIAPELLPFLTDGAAVKQRRGLVTCSLIGWLLASLAMAGPTWERTPLPVHKQESALVVLFDLSPSMLVQDLKPNRLTRARLKLIDLLQQRKEGTTGLVAYAADAFVVSPLTDDAATIAAMVPALNPNIMPGRGSNVEAALARAVELVLNTGQQQADLLLITDGIDGDARDEFDALIGDTGDFRLSILGIGTREGAPIPTGNGGFAKDASGDIVIPKLRANSLRQLAGQFDGRYTGLRADESDIHYLTEGFSVRPDTPSKQLDRTYDSWHDLGYWLVLPLLPLLMLAFRRGLLAGLLLLPLLGTPQPAMAFDWDDLWLTPDQQASRAMAEGDADSAQQLFEDPDWKAAAAYRSGDFESAEQLYQGDSATAHYNRGNALAKAGKLEEALKNYQQALQKQPDMEDARYNRDLVEKLRQQQQKQQQNQQSDDNRESGDQDGSNDRDQSRNEGQQDQQNPSQNGDQNSQNRDASGDDTGAESQKDKQTSEQQKSGDSDKQQNPDGQQQQAETPNGKQQDKQDGSPSQQGAQSPSTEMADEEKQAMEQWLRKIPDDPGGLLRKKFRYQAEKRLYEERRHASPPDNTDQRW